MDKQLEGDSLMFSQEQICQWLISHLSQVLNISAEQVDTSLEFDDYGLDSRDAVGMIGELSEWLNQDLDPGLIYEHPTISELSAFVASEREVLV